MDMCAKSRKMELVNMSQYQPYWYDVSCDNKYHPHRVLVCVTQPKPVQRQHQTEFWQNFVSLFVLASGVLIILIFVVKSGYSNMMSNTNNLASQEIEFEEYKDDKAIKKHADPVCHCEHVRCQRIDQNEEYQNIPKPDYRDNKYFRKLSMKRIINCLWSISESLA